jgi:hypothetical protein
MASKSSSSQRAHAIDSSAAADTARQAANDALAEMTRQQLAMAAECMAQLFRAGESLQRAQQQVSQRAALLHTQAAENLRNATNPVEVAYIQSGLMVSGMQEAMRCCQDMMMASARLGSDALRPGSQDPAHTVESATNMASSAANAAMNAAAPMMQAWQSLFTAPLNGGGASTTH